jgi:hypothetical protein
MKIRQSQSGNPDMGALLRIQDPDMLGTKFVRLHTYVGLQVLAIVTAGGSRRTGRDRAAPVLLPQNNFLLLLRLAVQVNRTQLVEVSSEDIKDFDTMVAQKKAIETALKKYKEK